MNKTMTTLLLCAGLFATSCHTPDPATLTPDASTEIIITNGITKIYDNNAEGEYIFGDTIITKKTVKLHTPPNSVDLGDLKKKDNSAIKYVAIGGSFTAGVKDWGLSQEGQLTSFPNLLALQLKTSSFSQPLFGDNEYNGYGVKVLKKGNDGGVPKYNAVKNNLAISSTSPYVTLNKFNGNADNIGIPYLHTDGMNWGADYKNNFSLKFAPFLDRITTVDKNSIYKISNGKNFDFFTLEIGLENTLRFALSGGNPYFDFPTVIFNSGESSMDFIVKNAKQNNKAIGGCLATIPDVTDLPYFKTITYSQLIKANGNANLYAIVNSENIVSSLNEYCLFIPNETIDSLLNPQIKINKRGLTKEKPLLDKDVLTTQEIDQIKSITKFNNNFYLDLGKKNGYPVADLYFLFQQIGKSNYYTEEKIYVEPWMNGNFYSSDGIHPTAFGQALIANEFIKAINQFYHSNIPLIQASQYLNK